MENLLGFLLELYRLAQDTSVSEFQGLALEMLKSVVRFRSATWSSAEVNARGAVEIFSVHLQNEPEEVRLQFAALNRKFTRRVMLAARQPGRAHLVNDTCGYFDRHDEEPFRAYIRRYEHDRNLLITDLSEWLSLYRPAADSLFAEKDTALINTLMPHLVEALRINRSLALGNGLSEKRTRPVGTHALIRHDGTFLHCGRSFLDLLRREWPDWSDPRIPRALLTQLSTTQPARIAQGGVEISAQTFGGALLLTARQVSPLSRLSPRELEITRQFGLGKSYKAIAIESRLAPATVRNVLQNAYRKLQIDNKAALARLLQLDHG